MATAAQKKQEEEAQAAQAASASGSTVVPPEEHEETKEEKKQREAAEDVANSLVDLPFDTLTRLRGAVDHALTTKGTEPAQSGPTLEEQAGSFPLNHDAHREFDSLAAVAKKADEDEKNVLSYSVRQARDAVGDPIGPQYLTVVRADSSKKTVEL